MQLYVRYSYVPEFTVTLVDAYKNLMRKQAHLTSGQAESLGSWLSSLQLMWWVGGGVRTLSQCPGSSKPDTSHGMAGTAWLAFSYQATAQEHSTDPGQQPLII